MGHLHQERKTIIPLIDRLNRYPIGLPDSETLRQILSLLFSEEEALVASRFPLREATLPELTRATGYPRQRLEPVLERMANKGLIMDLVYGDKTYYLLLPGLIGFFELTFMKQRQDLPVQEVAQLMQEYLFGDDDSPMAQEFFGSTTPLTRALVNEDHIPTNCQIATYERACAIVEQASYGAIGMCYCRHKKEHLGHSCQKGAPTEDICISLGNAARFMVRRGFAQERSVQQLHQVLTRARELSLTHVTDNIRNRPSFICNCCSCCCELLTGVQRGYPTGVAKTNFTLAVDSAACIGCGLCAKTCNVTALRLEPVQDGAMEVRVASETCLGCGACINACPVGALSLVPAKRPVIPANKKELFIQILRGKKTTAPLYRQQPTNARQSLSATGIAANESN
jgi:formate hydrogenlyase subunit 6/NADH:ubiquinone oxidoreductase subunit I